MRKILLIYQTIIPSVKLCGLEQCLFLQKEELIEFRHCPAAQIRKGDLAWADTLWMIRSADYLEQQIAKVCREMGKTLVYAIDDDLLHVPEDMSSGPYYAQAVIKKQITSIVRCAHAVASPSPRLLDQYAREGQKRFLLTEPSLYRVEGKTPHADGKIHIGFAGSVDRGGDIDLLLGDALRQIKDRYGDRVAVEFFGSEPAIAKELNFAVIPYKDSYEAYQQTMAELNWDIGLAPMQETQFHACKHYNKLIEYCGYGMVGIYSDVLPYSEGVENGVTGILCGNTPREWVEAMEQLVDDSELREKMSRNCLERANGAFTLQAAAQKLLESLETLPEGKTGWSKGMGAGIRAHDYWNRFVVKVRIYGWKTPYMILRKVFRFFRKRQP